VETLDWTYEVAPAGSDSAGLEEYVVETAAGDDAGKIHVVLEHEGDLFLVVEHGAVPPLARELVAVPAEDVESIDHSGLRVRLRARSEADLRALPRLDPARKVERREDEETPVDARRVVDAAGSLAPRSVAADSERAVDTSVLPLAIATGVLAAFTLLFAALMATAGADAWQWGIVVVAAVLALAAGALSYRAWRRPYTRA
jgi:hypothetical protein